MSGRMNLFGNLTYVHAIWAMVLVIPALYLNLGRMPLIGDEAIRALVALEMMFSGDYLIPTLNGELYFNKPPLYNWLLVLCFNIAGSQDEFFVRLPSTLFLLVYLFTIYFFTAKHLGRQTGLLASLVFLTCGRILFWDSFLGLIDITFSWVVFTSFMLSWQYSESGKYNRLFVVTYSLAALGFLLKGLPAVAFQGITLLSLFIYTRQFKRLFSPGHVAGILVFVAIAGTYYLIYGLIHPEAIKGLLIRIFTESADKSALGNSLGRTFRHLFTFPFELVYHFIPWMFFTVFLFHRRILRRALKNRFVAYCLIVFVANISLYWFSPVTYPRYLLMLFPLFAIVLLHLARMHAGVNTPHYRMMLTLFTWIMPALLLVMLVLPLVFRSEIPVRHLFSSTFILFVASTMIWWVTGYSRFRVNALFTMAVLLLCMRIAFNLFLVPHREANAWSSLCRMDAIEVAKQTLEEELYIAADTITLVNSYYLTRERGQIVTNADTLVPGPVYLMDDRTLLRHPVNVSHSMRITFYEDRLFAGKILTKP